jgi:hypothetical protein
VAPTVVLSLLQCHSGISTVTVCPVLPLKIPPKVKQAGLPLSGQLNLKFELLVRWRATLVNSMEKTSLEQTRIAIILLDWIDPESSFDWFLEFVRTILWSGYTSKKNGKNIPARKSVDQFPITPVGTYKLKCLISFLEPSEIPLLDTIRIVWCFWRTGILNGLSTENGHKWSAFLDRKVSL